MVPCGQLNAEEINPNCTFVPICMHRYIYALMHIYIYIIYLFIYCIYTVYICLRQLNPIDIGHASTYF